MRRPIRRLALALVGSAVAASLVVAAGGAGRTTSKVGAGGTYKVGWGQAFGFTDNMDPVGEYLAEGFGIHTNLLSRTLVGYRHAPGAAGNQIVADIATDRALSRLPVANAVQLEMTGHQWWWEARYADDTPGSGFAVANELHIPVGRPVVISLKADDVIHTFWVPNLHGKKDMIPGRESTIEFRADRPGTYRGQCAEFCGLEHALMAFTVVAEPAAQYDAWLARQRAPAPQPANALQARGERLFTTGNCAGCHTVRGTSAQGVLGPDLTHVMSRPMLGAGTFANTPANLESWIKAPGSMKPGTTMPPSQLSAQDLNALVAWIGTLQ